MLTSQVSDYLARSPPDRVCSVQRLASTVHYFRDAHPRGFTMARRLLARTIGPPFF
eukprot:COSAG02_NODE_28929_length_579_cov_1.020833_1_plen_55_part_01